MTHPGSSAAGIVRFGVFELDLRSRELRKAGARISLQDQPLEILQAILERPGELVTRDELRQRLWPADTFVDFEHGVNAAVKRLRDALGDSADSPRYVETIPRRGYRFIAPVNGMPLPVSTAIAGAAAAIEPRAADVLPQRRWRMRRLALMTGVVVAVALAVVVIPRLVGVFDRGGPRITGYTQLTRQEIQFPPFPSPLPLLTDGSRIYFTEWTNHRLIVRQVAAAGGETAPVPLSIDQNHAAEAISPDGSELLVGTFHGPAPHASYWIVPLVGGAPRRLGERVGEVRGQASDWLADGRILIGKDTELWLIDTTAGTRRKLASLPGRVYWPRWSRDRARIRLSVWNPTTLGSVWELRSDGTGARPLLPGWGGPPNECCGSWTADGQYFVFQATRGNETHLWALRDAPADKQPQVPVQLTSGPMSFLRPLPSRDGRKLFSVGWHLRAELVRYDTRTSALTPFLRGISAEWLDFSRDGRWVAYVSYPEAELWRARVDGTERLRLTAPPTRAFTPRWSPDGSRIAFVGMVEGRMPQVYVVDPKSALPTDLIPGGDSDEWDPTWAPDGRSIAFGTSGGVKLLEVATGNVSAVPGGGTFWSPRWSPDGRYLCALTPGAAGLVFFEVASRKWSEVVAMPRGGQPNWSRDSRHVYVRADLSAPSEPGAVYRVRVIDGKVERVMRFEGIRQVWGSGGTWVGLTPDDELLFLRDLSSHEIYALEWEAPH